MSKQIIMKHTIGKVSVSDYEEAEKKKSEQKNSDIPFILNIEYYPNTQIMELTQIEETP